MFPPEYSRPTKRTLLAAIAQAGFSSLGGNMGGISPVFPHQTRMAMPDGPEALSRLPLYQSCRLFSE